MHLAHQQSFFFENYDSKQIALSISQTIHDIHRIHFWMLFKDANKYFDREITGFSFAFLWINSSSPSKLEV